MVNLPGYGTKIHVKHSWKDYFSKHQVFVPDVYSTIGILVQGEKNDQPGSIRIETGNEKHPYAIIPSNRIISVECLSPNISKTRVIHEDIKTYLVKGSKGDSHTVKISGKQASCTCMGYKYSKSGECKHITEIRKTRN